MIRDEDVLTLDQIRTALIPVFQREKICFAYLFGSHAWGHPDSESDIDIAVFADPKLSYAERFQLRLDLMGTLAKALAIDIEKIDVVVMQDVPPLLKINSIHKGLCIFERDRSERNLALLHIEQEYDDEAPYLCREGEETIRKILTQPLA